MEEIEKSVIPAFIVDILDTTDVGIILKGVKSPLFLYGESISYSGGTVLIDSAEMAVVINGMSYEPTVGCDLDVSDILHLYAKDCDGCEGFTLDEENAIIEKAESLATPSCGVEVEAVKDDGGNTNVKSLFPF